MTKITKEWINPLEKYRLDTPPYAIARTAVGLLRACKDWEEQALDKGGFPCGWRKVLVDCYQWPVEAVKDYFHYVSGMTSAERKRAVAYADVHFNYDEFEAYKKEKHLRYFGLKGEK